MSRWVANLRGRRSLVLLFAVAMLGVLPSAAEASWSSRTKAPGIGSGILGRTTCPTSQVCLQSRTTGDVQRTTDGGATWVDAAGTIPVTTYGLDCPTTTACYATNSGGGIYKSTNLGDSWTMLRDGTPALYGIECPSSDICYAVGSGGTVRKTVDGGSNWTLQASGGTGILYSVSCPSTTVCYSTEAAGDTFKTSNGSTWTQVSTSAARPDLISPWTSGLSCPSVLVCYQGGTAGEISKTSDGGANWVIQTTVTRPDIYAMSCASETRCMAVGVAQDSIFTDDGGTTWTEPPTGSAAAMYSIAWAGPNRAIAGNAVAVPYVYEAPPPPLASLGVTSVLNAGTRSFIDATPGNVTFPAVSLGSADQTVTASQPLVIADATGSAAGWSVSVTSTTLTSGARTLSNNAVTVMGAPSIACKAGVTCTLATNTVTYPFTLPAATTAPTPQKLVNASAGTGLGAQTVTPIWRLEIPATTYAGTYTSTWTYTLSAGP